MQGCFQLRKTEHCVSIIAEDLLRCCVLIFEKDGRITADCYFDLLVKQEFDGEQLESMEKKSFWPHESRTMKTQEVLRDDQVSEVSGTCYEGRDCVAG